MKMEIKKPITNEFYKKFKDFCYKNKDLDEDELSESELEFVKDPHNINIFCDPIIKYLNEIFKFENCENYTVFAPVMYPNTQYITIKIDLKYFNHSRILIMYNQTIMEQKILFIESYFNNKGFKLSKYFIRVPIIINKDNIEITFKM